MGPAPQNDFGRNVSFPYYILMKALLGRYKLVGQLIWSGSHSRVISLIQSSNKPTARSLVNTDHLNFHMFPSTPRFSPFSRPHPWCRSSDAPSLIDGSKETALTAKPILFDTGDPDIPDLESTAAVGVVAFTWLRDREEWLSVTRHCLLGRLCTCRLRCHRTCQ